jgi:hypothetical protein
MHLLLIVVLLAIAFPALVRFFGSIVSMMFWLLVAGMFVAIIGAIF